jgi:hypothetical protein
MPRKKMNFEMVTARFPAGTFDRIGRVLKKDELKADFIRDSVRTKLEARERGRKPSLQSAAD